MGKVLMGNTKPYQFDLMSPEQQTFLKTVLNSNTGDAGGVTNKFLTGGSPEDAQKVFQQAYVDPAMKVFKEELVPGLQAEYADATGGQSSALNRALGKASTDIATNLAGKYGDMYNRGQDQQMAMLELLSKLGLTTTKENYVRETPGIAGDLIQMIGNLAAAGISKSSILVKEDIEPYENTDEMLEDMSVYTYRYKGEDEQKIGFIAEMMPEEVVTLNSEDILSVDMYGVLAIAVNAIKSLRRRVNLLQNHVRSMNGYMQNYLDYDEALADEYVDDDWDDELYRSEAE